MRRWKAVTRGRVLALGFASFADCSACRDSHPYVPYSIGAQNAPGQGSAGGAVVQAEAGPSLDGAAPFEGALADAAPAGTAQWLLNGLTLNAPEGLVFALALTGDFDADGLPDAFAIVRPPAGFDPGRAVFYRGDGSAAALTPTASFVPPSGLLGDASCTPLGRLRQAGSHAVFLELGTHCPGHPPRTPSRWVAVLGASGAGASLRFAATVADPAGALPLVLDASVADRDGDRRDDVAIRIVLDQNDSPGDGGPPDASRVSVTLAWLDRPAGLSRDVAATEGSFAALADSAELRAERVKTASDVPRFVARVRALFRATCSEGGAPRVLAASGTGDIACGAGQSLGALGLAEVRAYVTSGDALRGAFALDNAERPPASVSQARLLEARKRIARLAPVSAARLLRNVAAVPNPGRAHEPSWGALAFEPSGKLLVRTRAGVVRVDPDQGDEAAADSSGWDLGVDSPDRNSRWLSATDSCDGLPLEATFAVGDGGTRNVALPLSAWGFGRCNGAGSTPVPASPVAWGAAGLEALVQGELLLLAQDLAQAIPLPSFAGQKTTPGAPRSPDGKLYVFATATGLMVRGESRTRLLRSSELDGTYSEQRDCAVSNDGTHVACIQAGERASSPKAWVGTWDQDAR